MNNQIFYNSPLLEIPACLPSRTHTNLPFPLPNTSTISKSLPSSPMNHPLPPKPPVSKYFISASFAPANASGALRSIPPGQAKCDQVIEGDNTNNSCEREPMSKCLGLGPPARASGSQEQFPPTRDISNMSHGLRRGSCEIVDIDELDDFDDLPHPDTLFSQLWKDVTPQKSCKTSGEILSADATESSMPDLATQDGRRDFPQKYTPEDEAYTRDGCQADGIDETSSLPDKIFITIYDGGHRPCDKETAQESTGRSVSFLRNDQDVDRPDKEDNRA